MKIILLGYMGSGKSSVGKLLAEKLGHGFLDLDAEIVRAEGREIPEIFKTSGEIYFRKKETESLRRVLDSGARDLVLSIGGGTPCYGNNLQIINDAPETISIYLKTSLKELTERLMTERESRPLIRHLATEELLNDFIRKHLFERAYYYNQSDLIVDTDGKDVGAIVQEITEKVSG